MHALRNEQLPLRTLVQVLFMEQERTTRVDSSKSRYEHVAEAPIIAAHTEIEESAADPRDMGKEMRKESDIMRPPPLSRRTGKQVMEAERGKWIQKKKD